MPTKIHYNALNRDPDFVDFSYFCALNVRPMPNIIRIEKPGDMLAYVGADNVHPLVGVIDYEAISPIPSSLNDYGVYGLFLHSQVRNDLTYGRGAFNHSTGCLICVAPGQIGGREDVGDFIEIDGWALLFHPDLLIGTQLEKDIRQFSFFDYSANEAVFLNDDERNAIISLIKIIRDEINRPVDVEQNAIIVSYISAILHSCNRAYTRQFHQIRQASDDILVRLSSLLNDYYDSNLQLEHGIPGVQYYAEKLNISPNYFSDLVKKTTGENASNFIRNHIMRMAKNKLMAIGNVSQVAYDLGFDYPQHFSRMFKKHTGMTPKQYIDSTNR